MAYTEMARLVRILDENGQWYGVCRVMVARRELGIVKFPGFGEPDFIVCTPDGTVTRGANLCSVLYSALGHLLRESEFIPARHILYFDAGFKPHAGVDGYHSLA